MAPNEHADQRLKTKQNNCDFNNGSVELDNN